MANMRYLIFIMMLLACGCAPVAPPDEAHSPKDLSPAVSVAGAIADEESVSKESSGQFRGTMSVACEKGVPQLTVDPFPEEDKLP